MVENTKISVELAFSIRVGIPNRPITFSAAANLYFSPWNDERTLEHIMSIVPNFLKEKSSAGQMVTYAAVALGAWLAGMAVLHHLLTDLPDIDSLQNYEPPVVSRILDIHGETVSEFFVERRLIVPITDIPVNLQNAVMATEDQYFNEHWGINPRGILRAFLANLRHGRVVEGGSTITQQLSKVLFFSQQKTFARKIRELLLAIQLEHNYSKPEILQLYLNQIYFGHGAYGVEAAAKTFFGKSVKDLDLSECAILAGTIRSPRTYSPFLNPKNAKHRRSWVLSRMEHSGFITPEQEKEAEALPLITEKPANVNSIGAYFAEYVRQELEPKYGDNSLYQGGFTIYSTIDINMQRAAEEEMNKSLADFDIQRAKEKAAEERSRHHGKKYVAVESTATGDPGGSSKSHSATVSARSTPAVAKTSAA